MLRNRTRAAEMVVEKLIPAETGLDHAMSTLLGLTHAMLEARAEARVSAVVGQEAFDRVGEATSLLFQARSKLIDAHLCLNQAKVDIGLRSTALGAWQDCPPLALDPAANGDNVVALGR